MMNTNHRLRAIRNFARLTAGAALAFILAHNAGAAVDVLINSDGSNPAVFPNLKVHYGTVLFDVPIAKIFGLDVNNGLQPLPPADRFPGDLFGTQAMNRFIATPSDHNERGILFSFGGFNNPNPDPMEIARLTFTIPLLDDAGNPLGGPGMRWIKFQNGPNAGGGGGGGGGAASKGRAGGWLQPPMTTLKVWAGVIKAFTANPGETEDEFRARVRAAVEEKVRRRGGTRAQVMKYTKLVDDSDYKDPKENWILEVPTTYAAGQLEVELAFYVQQGTFIKLAELLNNFTVAITNDPTIAPTDPNNQPPGEILIDVNSLPDGSGADGDTVSVALADFDVTPTAIVLSQTDPTLSASTAEVTFHTVGRVEQTGAATQYLDLFVADGSVYRVPFDQAFGDTATDIAKDLATTVNIWPHDGGFQFEAVAEAHRVMIRQIKGLRIQSARILHTNNSEVVEEQVLVGTCLSGCRVFSVRPAAPPAHPGRRPAKTPTRTARG